MDLHDKTRPRAQCLIGGEWTDADEGASLPVHNPATGELPARVAKAETITN